MDIHEVALGINKRMQMLNEVGGRHLDKEQRFSVTIWGTDDKYHEAEVAIGYLKIEVLIRMGSVN